MAGGTHMRIAVCIFLCFAGPCSAQQLDPFATVAANAATKTIRGDTMRAHMHFLSDSLLEDRAPGTRGYDIAARYVQATILPFSSGISLIQPRFYSVSRGLVAEVRTMIDTIARPKQMRVMNWKEIRAVRIEYNCSWHD